MHFKILNINKWINMLLIYCALYLHTRPLQTGAWLKQTELWPCIAQVNRNNRKIPEKKNKSKEKQQKTMNLHLKLKNLITLCPVLVDSDVSSFTCDRSANVLSLHISFLSHSLRCLFRLLVGLPALLQVSDRDLQISLSFCQLFAALRENRINMFVNGRCYALVQSIC